MKYLSNFSEHDVTQGQFFKQSAVGLNSEFSFYTGCLTKAKVPSLSYYIPTAEEKTDGFMFSLGDYNEVNCKYLYPGFELESSIQFSMIITVTLSTPQKLYN